MQPNNSNLWRFNQTCSLCWKQFDERRSIVFDEGSGQTHIVNELCLDVLEILQIFSLNVETLADALARRNGLFLDGEWCSYIYDMLADLDQRGLIEPVFREDC